MKKILPLILAAVFMLSLAACGDNSEKVPANTPSDGANSTTPDEASNWYIMDEEDDFGDKTGKKILLGVFTGNFRNTATNDSELTASIGCHIKTFSPNNPVATFYINLFEYGDHRATFTENEAENMSIRMKIGNTEEEHKLICYPPYSSFFFDESADITSFGNALLNGDEIKCVIDIGSSRYNFNVDSTGFSEKYETLCVELYPLQIEMQKNKLEPSLLEKKWITDDMKIDYLVFTEGGQVDVYKDDGSCETVEWSPWDVDDGSTGVSIVLSNRRVLSLCQKEQDGEIVLYEDVSGSTYRAYALDTTEEEIYDSIAPLLINKKWTCSVPENGNLVFFEDGKVESHKSDGKIVACEWEAMGDDAIRVNYPNNSYMTLYIENKNGKITLFTKTSSGEILTTYSTQ